MADERKKRLEEIRNRKRMLQKLVEANPAESPSPVIPEPAKDTSSHMETSASDSNSTSKTISTNPSFHAPKRTSVKNEIIFKIQRKKINESLHSSKSEHYIRGIKKEKKNEETQYKLPQEFEEEKKSEETAKDLGGDKTRKGSIFSSIFSAAKRTSVHSTGKDKWKLNFIHFGKTKLSKEIKNIEMRSKFYEKNETNLKNYLDTKFSLMNKALAANDIFDICNTYYNEEETNLSISKRTLASHLYDIFDEQSSGRIVTALDWSPNQNDLFLASFSGTEDSTQQSGLIQLWSLTNRKVPSYVINYQTEITSAIFYKDNPNLVIGGSMTGQILLWDTKSGRAVPEQKTPLGIGTKDEKNKEVKDENNLHKFPVHCLAILEKNRNLISISTDGVLCEWNLSNLSRPINKYDISNLKNEQQGEQSNEIGPLCVGACQNKNSNEFIIGCDRNDIYNISLKDKDFDILNSFSGSRGPIFCISPHPLIGENGPDFSDLFLSCGADWTTKLWSTKIPDIPLFTFSQSQDYVYSAKWHPINPYIFATGDGSGFIDLWDLNRDWEIPTFRYNLKNAVNKLAWSFDGKKLAAGDINGSIAIFSSEKDVMNVRNDDINKFYNKLCLKKNEFLKQEKENN